MVDSDSQVFAAQDKEVGAFEAIDHGKSLSFNWCISGLCWVSKSASDYNTTTE